MGWLPEKNDKEWNAESIAARKDKPSIVGTGEESYKTSRDRQGVVANPPLPHGRGSF
jgi:hypothetical protein